MKTVILKNDRILKVPVVECLCFVEATSERNQPCTDPGSRQPSLNDAEPNKTKQYSFSKN